MTQISRVESRNRIVPALSTNYPEASDANISVSNREAVMVTSLSGATDVISEIHFADSEVVLDFSRVYLMR